jgi:hypothetical protein
MCPLLLFKCNATNVDLAPYAPGNAKADDDEGYNGGMCVRAKKVKGE